MFSVLPDFTPRECHSLWYSNSRNPNLLRSLTDPSTGHHPHDEPPAIPSINEHDFFSVSNPSHQARSRNMHAALLELSPLGRLRADEEYAERRRVNISNLGSTWLKPPGIPKTLFQLREEQREAREHAEALRREQSAQELVTAVAEQGQEGEGIVAEMDMEGLDEEAMGQEGQDYAGGGGVRDLDAEIPDADDGGFGYDISSDEEEDEEDEDVEEDDEQEYGEEHLESAVTASGYFLVPRSTRERETANLMATVRASEDRAHEMMSLRGTSSNTQFIGAEDEDVEYEHQEYMIQEDDLLDPSGLNMSADLDGDIPEAESGSYEHTDSDASVSDEQTSGMASARSSRYRASLPLGESLASNSLDVSGLLSANEGTVAGSSLQGRRRH